MKTSFGSILSTGLCNAHEDEISGASGGEKAPDVKSLQELPGGSPPAAVAIAGEAAAVAGAAAKTQEPELKKHEAPNNPTHQPVPPPMPRPAAIHSQQVEVPAGSLPKNTPVTVEIATPTTLSLIHI